MPTVYAFRSSTLEVPSFVSVIYSWFSHLSCSMISPPNKQFHILFNISFCPPFTHSIYLFLHSPPSFHLYTNPYFQSSIKPQIHQSINSFIQPSIHPPFHTSINLRLCVCVCRCAGVRRIVQRSTRPHTNPSIHLHIHPSATYTLTHAPIHPAIKLFIHPSTAQIYPSTH